MFNFFKKRNREEMQNNFQELFEKYAGISSEKQENILELIGDKAWNADMIEGTLTFDENLIFPAQILGSVSHIDNTWLWIWANKNAEYNEKMIRQANDLRKYGELHSIYELSAPSFEVYENDCHKIGMIASGLYDYSFYYSGNYGEGSALFTVKSSKINKNMKNNPENILKVFPKLISIFEMNHRNAFRHYLLAKDFSISEEDKNISGKHENFYLNAEFDELDRLIKLSTK
ncbi:DUF6882 domain-containing protein [Sebaldella termitidis]|uniref:DUF6882 domain-containing protein n=1 Tax=Sebaldella termitidis TaxID=826 RepID=UPI003EBFAF3A